LGKTYSDEGKYAYAAQVYLRGAKLRTEEFPWRKRLAFYGEAAREYERASIYPKAVEVCWDGIRDFEDTGLSFVEAGEEVGELLFAMGRDFRRMDRLDDAAKAFQQYLKYYPKGGRAASAEYFLAQCYESEKRNKEALDQYTRLAAEAKNLPFSENDKVFWSNLATKTADQLRWEDTHPGLSKGDIP
jgi:tetratricopeptide (TPR) repeat protein